MNNRRGMFIPDSRVRMIIPIQNSNFFFSRSYTSYILQRKVTNGQVEHKPNDCTCEDTRNFPLLCHCQKGGKKVIHT